MKIRTKVNSSDLVDDEAILTEFMNKSFLKFFISIFKHSKSCEDWHVLDMFLLKGNTQGYLTLSQRFFHDIQLRIDAD